MGKLAVIPSVQFIYSTRRRTPAYALERLAAHVGQLQKAGLFKPDWQTLDDRADVMRHRILRVHAMKESP